MGGLNEATRRNLERKAAFADHVQLHQGIPLPSWLDLSVADICNRVCPFCPHADPTVYPNQNLHMSLDTADNIAMELADLKYIGVVVFSGFGEPLLHPRIVDMVKTFKNEKIRVEIVTNGDRLTPQLAAELFKVGLDHMVISMYDGPEQINHFNAMFQGLDLAQDRYSLRDRWHGPEDDFGLKLTNRAGTVFAGEQPQLDVTRHCHYPSYSMMVDWNGDVLLCVQDWNKKVRFGNVNDTSLFDIWKGSALSRRRHNLCTRGRVDSPCRNCNADGTLHGADHVEAWKEWWGHHG